MQRTHGNQAVQRMVRDSVIAQRYTVIPQFGKGGARYQYQPETPQTQMFPSQKVDFDRENDQDERGRDRTRYTLRSKTTHSEAPRLRVADTGEMAIADSVGGTEQKVFYARPDLIRASQQRLEDIEASVTLDLQGSTITVPAQPQSPQSGQTKTLSMVVPRRADQPKGTAFPGRVDVCNQFADDIMGKTGERTSVEDVIATFQTAGGDKKATREISYKESRDDVTPANVVKAISGGEIRDPATLAAQLGPDDARIDPAARAEIDKFVGDHGVSMIEVARDTYAKYSTPPAARLEIRTRIERGQQLKALDVEAIVARHTDVPPGVAYGAMDPRTYKSVHAGLGTNEYAAPEVGESFGGMSYRGSGIAKIDHTGNPTGLVELGGLSKKQTSNLASYFEPAAAKIELVNTVMPLVKELHDQVRTRVWSWHFAAVVAKSGSDTVTLENYNRRAGDKFAEAAFKDKLWLDLQKQYKNLLKQNKVLRMNIQSASDAAQKVDLLMQEIGNFGNDLQSTLLAFAKNPGVGNARWFFQMYGPANKGQSFHDVWAKNPKGGLVNGLTLRFGEGANAAYKKLMKQKLKEQIVRKEAVLHPYDNPADYSATTNYRRMKIEQIEPIFAQIDAATTKVEVSDAYRAAIALLGRY